MKLTWITPRSKSMMVLTKDCNFHRVLANIALADDDYYNYHKAIDGYKIIDGVGEEIHSDHLHMMAADMQAQAIVIPFYPQDVGKSMTTITAFDYDSKYSYMAVPTGNNPLQFGWVVARLKDVDWINWIGLYGYSASIMQAIKATFPGRFKFHLFNALGSRRDVQKAARAFDSMDTFMPIQMGLWGKSIDNSHITNMPLTPEYFESDYTCAEDRDMVAHNLAAFRQWASV